MSRASMVAQRVRARSRRARRAVADLAPTSWTLGRMIRAQPAPGPREFAAFGDRSAILPPTRVRNPGRISVGAGAVVLEGGTLWALDESEGGAPGGGRLSIADDVILTRWCTVIAGVGIDIGRRVASSDYATVLDTWAHPFAPRGELAEHLATLESGPVRIGDGAYLGFNCMVLPGVTIGAGAFVGENAVVTADVPPRTVVRGNPARVCQTWDEARQTWVDVA